MDVRGVARQAGMLGYCAAIGIASVAVGSAMSDALRSSGTIALLLPLLVGGLFAIAAGATGYLALLLGLRLREAVLAETPGHPSHGGETKKAERTTTHSPWRQPQVDLPQRKYDGE